jgi:group I intron endonuclease
MIGIYKITNPNNKIYIGQSTNIKERFKKYSTLSNKRQTKLYNSFQKYGIDNHQFEIIEECSGNQLDEREIYWGNQYDVLGDNGLNLRLGNGRGSCSEETKNKISNSLKGQRKSKEHCLHLSIAKTGIPSKRKDKPDLKQKGQPKPGAGGKNQSKSGAGPKTGNQVICVTTNKIYNSIKDCIGDTNISKRKMFSLLKEGIEFRYINRNYYKNKQI